MFDLLIVFFKLIYLQALFLSLAMWSTGFLLKIEVTLYT